MFMPAWHAVSLRHSNIAVTVDSHIHLVCSCKCELPGAAADGMEAVV
jgi:hypothetical protein